MLPTLNFQNNYGPLDPSLESELLTITTVDNNLAIYPGYSTRASIFTTKFTEGRYYQRQQMHTLLSTKATIIRARVTGDTIAGLVKINLLQASYVQIDRPLVSPAITEQIITTGKYPGRGLFDLWSPNDYWYITELLGYVPFSMADFGSPTKLEKQAVALAAVPSTSTRSSGFTRSSTSDREVIKPDVDYRLYRPIKDNVSSELGLLFNPEQLTIEAKLTPILIDVFNGKQAIEVLPSKSYNAKALPQSPTRSSEALEAARDLFLLGVDAYMEFT